MPNVFYPEFFKDLHFHVRVFDAKDDKVSFLTCAASDLTAAHFAYDNAVKEYPNRAVRLMQWSRVIKENRSVPGSEPWTPSEEWLAEWRERNGYGPESGQPVD